MSDTHSPDRRALTSRPILPAIAERWSPRAFAPVPLSFERLAPCFEAARWAASAFNLQPWTFLCGLKGDAAHARILAALNEFNALWAKEAGALVVAVAHEVKPDGSPNHHAEYDLGQAASLLAVQATKEGLHAHQMAGFDATAIAAGFALPQGLRAITVMAIGELGQPANLPEKLAERELAPRTRKPLDEVVRQAAFA